MKVQNRPQISVVMTTYNGERHVLQQLDTIRQQSLQPDEVIILDDGSVDSTPQLIREYIHNYSLYNWHFSIN